MALNNQPKGTVAVGTTRCHGKPEYVSEGEEVVVVVVEVEELEKLESEATEMAKRILEYRVTLPDQLRATLSSMLSAQRLILPETDSGLNFVPRGECNPGAFVSRVSDFIVPQKMKMEMKI